MIATANRIFSYKCFGRSKRIVDDMKLSKENTFIFNWVEDYDQQIGKLKKTFENPKLHNRVKIFNNITRSELQEAVLDFTLRDFGLFRYVTVVILDNKCKNEHFIRTSDKYEVKIYSEFVTLLKSNKTLASIPILFVIQKLQDFYETEEEIDDENGNETRKVADGKHYIHPKLEGIETIYEYLEFSIKANERTNNFRESPFIDVFCEEFSAKSTHIPMPEIASEIRKKCKINYKTDMVLGSNQGTDHNGVLGKAVEPATIRDYFK